MKKIGFLISEKENEKRKAIVFDDLKKIENRKSIYLQKGYFDDFGYSDQDIINIGANVCEKDEIIKNCDVIIDPKIGDSEDLKKIKNKIIFGWIHATQNFDITQKLIDNKITAYAWEKMFEDNRHTFYINNQIAGQAAIIHSSICIGDSYENKKVAVLGNGNTAFGAITTLTKLGANIDVYNRRMENCFRKNMYNYDIIVNCILWDVNRKDHIIYKNDLEKMKNGTVIIDVSCDHNGGIESSVPTTIDNPIYVQNGIIHYVVDHTPSLLYKDASKSISNAILNHLDFFISNEKDEVVEKAKIIEEGKIIDKEIIFYQNRELN